MIDLFIEHLVAATARIPARYFLLPVAGLDDPVMRERVYCYELYHQLRRLFERDRDLAHYVLSGEIDKGGHPVIRRCAPDFVFHSPGSMNENLLVVEVKSVDAGVADIQKDREKLEYFVSDKAGYESAIEHVYGGGGDEEALRPFLDVFRNADQRIRLFWHHSPGEAAIRILR